MRRALVGASRARLHAARVSAFPLRSIALAAVVLGGAAPFVSGCGEKPARQESLGFEFDSAPDSAKLVSGRPLLREFEPYRGDDGRLRVRGRFALPDGARLQISVRRSDDGREVGREQVRLLDQRFDSTPIPPIGPVLPEGAYRFVLSTEFNAIWQPANVLSATRNGLDLTGPGMRRGAHGEALYRMTLEQHL